VGLDGGEVGAGGEVGMGEGLCGFGGLWGVDFGSGVTNLHAETWNAPAIAAARCYGVL